MKRKEYRNRLEVLLSVERDRWPDFVDLCDREHKSTSLKFSEMMEDELQKNALGVGRQPNPLNIHTYTYVPEIPSLSEPKEPPLDYWFSKIGQTNNIQEVGYIQGYGNKIVLKCKIRINQLKSRGEGYSF